jgi:hypothetical protein
VVAAASAGAADVSAVASIAAAGMNAAAARLARRGAASGIGGLPPLFKISRTGGPESVSVMGWLVRCGGRVARSVNGL